MKSIESNLKQSENLRISKQTDIASGSVTLTRADFVILTIHTDRKTDVTHADGTNISRDPYLGTTSFSHANVYPKVSFSTDPKIGKRIETSKWMSVSRKIINERDTTIIERVSKL